VRKQWRLDKLVAIQIDEGNFLVPELIRNAAFEQNQVRIALVARALADEHLLSVEAPETLCRGGNKERVRIDVAPGNVIHQVGLQENGSSADIQAEQVQALP
jgi:hypothetical protein